MSCHARRCCRRRAADAASRRCGTCPCARARCLALLAGVILGFLRPLARGVMAERHAGNADRRPPHAAARSPLSWQEASLFAEVYERIKRDYVDDVDDHALMEKAVRGMVAALDPHSAFLTARSSTTSASPPWAPTPVLASRSPAEDGVVRILRPIEDSPAQRAGLLPGDDLVQHRRGRHRGGSRRGDRAHARPVRAARDPERAPRGRPRRCCSSRCAAPRSRCTASRSRRSSPGTAMCGSPASARPPPRASTGRIARLRRDNPRGQFVVWCLI